MSAALDAVKEHVELPWRLSSPSPSPQPTPETDQTIETEPANDSDESVSESIAERQTGLDILADTDTETPSTPETPPAEADSPAPLRLLHWRNFEVALKEITPSSSEALGTLSDLRKWNDEFGEGRKEKKKQVWGKGRFGFTPRSLNAVEEGKVRTDGSGSGVDGV